MRGKLAELSMGTYDLIVLPCLPEIKILICNKINHHPCTNTDYIFTIIQEGFK